MLESCCCFRLKTAGVIIGWLGVAGSIFMIAVYSAELSRSNEFAKTSISYQHSNDYDKNELLYATSGHSSVATSIIVIACSAIHLIVSVLLIAGTVKERHLLLIPWLLDTGVLVGGHVLMMLVYIIVFASGKELNDFEVISTGFIMVVHSYIYYVIYSLYKQIQAACDMEQCLLPPSSPSHSKI